jgi:hypothetical protein
MKQLLKKVKQISMLLLVISLLGCENDDDNYPEVIAGFTYKIETSDTSTVTFINTSVNSRNYFWTFGDETSSTLINPVKTYTAGEYIVTLKATNVAGASDTFESLIVISDVGAPVITLLGDTTMNIMIGEPFTDPGYTAVDDVDGDLTANIVVGGAIVDVNTAGTYIITYNVSDAAGNAATQRTRTVIVAADTVAPVITLLGNATMNIMVGDTFTDPGATATDDVDGDITASIVVAGDVVDVNTAATYTITYNVSDAAGNAATEKTRTVIVAATPGTTGAYIYATSETVTIPSLIDNWGSGTTIVSDYSGDATYNPSIQLTSGTAWGDVSALAFTEMEAGILSNYSTLEFKIKTSDYTTIRVKVPENEIIFNIADGTPLANGWVQMSLPLSNWSNEVATANQFAILEFGAGTILITDVMLSGEGGGVTPPPSGDCPAPPAGELLSNGDFEAGGCFWQFFAGTGISSTISNGGTKSGEIQGSTGAATGIKMERFATGLIQPNTSYTVTFDIIASGAFGEGGLMKVFTFSEGADGGNVGATQHVLTDNTTAIATTWEKKTFTFTTPGNANQVEGGLSFLIELVNSAAKLNVDNVVIKKTP